jgi:hypothetical protein
MTEVFAVGDRGTYEFDEIGLALEREHEFIYEAVYRGHRILVTTNPNPSAAELIDALLTKAKERDYFDRLSEA